MRSKRTPTLRSRPVWALVILFASLLSPALARADSYQLAGTAAPPSGLAQLDGLSSRPDGLALALAADAGPAPMIAAGFQRFGTGLSEPIALAAPATRLKLTYAAQVPAGAGAHVDLRGSLDGRTWLPWLTNLPSGAVAAFSRPVRFAQYRVTLLGGLGESPLVRDVRLFETSQAPTVSSAAPAPFAVAPTFRVRATRQGMVGGRTANGFVIPPRARFVSLPSWSVLSTRGQDEYQVRISYKGRSSVVPVYDVGPYSERDDYWDAQRDGFPQLDRGWPMDHAAYYEGFNGGQADKGYVRYPTAIDVGDGVWWDELGINGDQAEVEVTYLWLGQDPYAGPPARDPAAPDHVVDELGGDFWQSAPALNASAVGCGMGRHAYWAASTTDPNAGAPVARWQPNLPAEALYDLYVHVPACPAKRAPVAQARYVVQHRDGVVELAVSQQQPGWILVGRFPFRAGPDGFLQLGALAGDSGTVWFDQARWVPVP